MMNRTTAKKREPPEKAALFLSLPFKGEELCSIGRPVDGRRTLLGLGLYIRKSRVLSMCALLSIQVSNRTFSQCVGSLYISTDSRVKIQVRPRG